MGPQRTTDGGGAGPVGSQDRLTAPDPSRVDPGWLALREDADAAARAPGLLEPLRQHLSSFSSPNGPLRVRDLGCGTGSLLRWLAGRLDGPQHWILHDHDPALLDRVASGASVSSADGCVITVETDLGDLTALRAADLEGTSLVAASALLDMLTFDEVNQLAAACVEAQCAALLAISVTGRVDMTPPDPLDGDIAAAFDAHQRRTVRGRRLLGPDAVEVAAAAFARRGSRVLSAPSPWRLGHGAAAMTGVWLRGRVGAAVEWRADLAPAAAAYLDRRLEECATGELRVVVHHTDLLALPALPASAAPTAPAALAARAALRSRRRN